MKLLLIEYDQVASVVLWDGKSIYRDETMEAKWCPPDTKKWLNRVVPYLNIRFSLIGDL